MDAAAASNKDAAAAAAASSKPTVQATVRKPGGKRLSIVLTTAAYVLLGIPVWWQTTRIPRPSLPHGRMQHTDRTLTNTTLFLPMALHVYILQPGHTDIDGAELAHTVYQHLSQSKPTGSPNMAQVSVVIEEQDASCHHSQMTLLSSQPPDTKHTVSKDTGGSAWHLPCLDLSQRIKQYMQQHQSALHEMEVHIVDALLQQALDKHAASIAGQYVLFVLPGRCTHAEGLVVGQYRHMWLWSGAAHGQGLRELLIKSAVPALTAMTFPDSGAAAVAAARKLPMSAAGQAMALFTLANGYSSGPQPQHAHQAQAVGAAAAAARHAALPAGDSPAAAAQEEAAGGAGRGTGAEVCGPPGHYTWQFDSWQATYLQPLADALSMLMDLHFHSQVRLHTTSQVVPKWSEKHGAYVLRTKQLPYFIDSEWNLDFGLDASTGSHSWSQAQDRSKAGDAGTCPWVEAGAGAGTAQPGCGMHHEERTLKVLGEEQLIPAHVIHMVLYVPPPAHRPLQILQPGSAGVSPTNSFSILSWGAVYVLPDPPGCSNSSHRGRSPAGSHSSSTGNATNGPGSRQQELGDANAASEGLPVGGALTAAEAYEAGAEQVAGGQSLDADVMHSFAERVVAGLRVLLGLPTGPQLPTALKGPSDPPGFVTAKQQHLQGVQVLASSTGVAAWEVDMLVRARVAADIASTARILGSFSRLAQELPNLAMPNLIGRHLADALYSLERAVEGVQAGAYELAAAAARAAHGSAEAAFSHPAILAQLSFPESHKVGVYMPFFFPALLPVVLALVSEGRRYWARSAAYRRSQKGVVLSLEEQDQQEVLRALKERDAARQRPTARE